MISFNIPINLNGSQLVDELISAGIFLSPRDGFYKNINPPLIENNKLWLDISESQKDLAHSVILAHNGIDSVPTIADKLASVGLDFEELKAAILGGGN